MFLAFSHLNEGSFAAKCKECRGREFYEGINPKNTDNRAGAHLWQPGGYWCKNKHWEKLRK